MDEHLKYLRMENKKLQSRHNELESNLTEEKEMVKYLHGVIKNYQQLLKKPETTRHLKTASLKKARRTVSARRLATESDAEEFFVKKLVEMSSDCMKYKGDEGINDSRSQSSALVASEDKQTTATHVSNCENSDRINTVTNRQARPNDSLSSRVDDIQADVGDTMFPIAERHEGDSAGENFDFRAEAEKSTATRSKHENVLQDMVEMLDSMMAKATMHENGLRQKDKHLKRMERRYEYLASIALGEESEWL